MNPSEEETNLNPQIMKLIEEMMEQRQRQYSPQIIKLSEEEKFLRQLNNINIFDSDDDYRESKYEFDEPLGEFEEAKEYLPNIINLSIRELEQLYEEERKKMYKQKGEKN